VVGGPTGTLGRATVLVAVVAATAVLDRAAAALEVAPGVALVFPAEALTDLDRERGAQFDSGVVEFLEQAVAEGGRGGDSWGGDTAGAAILRLPRESASLRSRCRAQ